MIVVAAMAAATFIIVKCKYCVIINTASGNSIVLRLQLYQEMVMRTFGMQQTAASSMSWSQNLWCSIDLEIAGELRMSVLFVDFFINDGSVRCCYCYSQCEHFTKKFYVFLLLHG